MGRTPPLTLFVLASLSLLGAGCGGGGDTGGPGPERGYMRSFVQGLSAYAKSVRPGFLIVPQNGVELLTTNGEPDGPLADAYLGAIDAQAQEDLFYGYQADDRATPAQDTNWLAGFLDLAKAASRTVLVADYCWTAAKVDDSYAQNASRGYLSFAAPSRDLDRIPTHPAPIPGLNANDVTNPATARNFLYLINPADTTTVNAFLDTLRGTSHDLLIIDAFFHGAALTPTQVASLKSKAGGGRRLVLAYMSIGEAEDYRYYWQPAWPSSPPPWLQAENPDWPGNYLVEFWDPAWQGIVFGTPPTGPDTGSYLDRIMAAGFDGAYLDIIEAYEFFE